MDNTLRLRLDIAYDGTDFHGWARQKGDLRTVQQTIEDALSLVLRTDVALTVAGRTDAGVHAAGQVAHTDIPAESLNQRSIDGDPGRLATVSATSVRKTSESASSMVCWTVRRSPFWRAQPWKSVPS